MRQKALENLRAAETLAAVPLPNAAATRAYYAAYHACWHTAEHQGYEVPEHDGKRYWRHDVFPSDMWRWGLLDEDGKEVLEQLYEKRVVADYYEDEITHEEAAALTRQARGLIHSLGGSGEC